MSKKGNPWNRVLIETKLNNLTRQFAVLYQEGYPKEIKTRWLRKKISEYVGEEIGEIEIVEIK